MIKPWQRSLYSRLVFGFVGSIGCVLFLQTMGIGLWLSRIPDGPELSRFTRDVAADLGESMAAHPTLDVDAYVRAKYARPRASLFIVLATDSRVITPGPLQPSPDAVRAAQDYYRQARQTRLPAGWVTGQYRASPIHVDGELAGSVGVVVRNWQYLIGWKMAALSTGVLLIGTACAGFLILIPIKRRLASLEEAATKIGRGEFAVVAPETGDDELTAVARAFNRMTAALRGRDEQLRAADQARRLLLADVSHELLTPLTAIRVHHEVLASTNLPTSLTAARSLDVIRDETHRLEQVVEDLLDLARMEAAGQAFNREHVWVESLFGRVAARHARDAEMRGVTLTTSVAPGAEALYGDPLRLEQALQNLAANARRHTPPGGSIHLEAQPRGDDLVIAVTDTGEGIPEEHLPFVFDRFYKVDAARAGGAACGSGLGLSIVKAIVERHGGSTTVRSQPGVSTTFEVRLPLPATASAVVRESSAA